MKFALPPLSEHQIRNKILSILAYEGYFVWTNNVGAATHRHTDRYGITRERHVRFGKPGMSDIIGIQPRTGRFVAIEVKTPARKNTVTPWQQQFIDDVNEKGGIAFVAWSEDMVAEKLGFIIRT